MTVHHQQEVVRAANDALSHSNADLQQFVILPATIYKNRYEWSPIYSQILKREFGEKLEPAGGKHIGSAVQAALRMERLLKDFLAYALVSTSGQEPTEQLAAGEMLGVTLDSSSASWLQPDKFDGNTRFSGRRNVVLRPSSTPVQVRLVITQASQCQIDPIV